MIATLAAAVLVLAQVQATQPAERPLAAAPVDKLAAGSPERAYVAFYNAVRAGEVEEALKLAQPIEPAHRPFFAALFKTLHDIEVLKAAALRRFPGEDAATVFEATGMVSPRTATTAEAKVGGDAATITLIAPDSRQREVTRISLARVNGVWLVSPFDAAGTGTDEAEERAELLGPGKLAATIASYEAAAARISLLRPRLDRGEFAGAEQVMAALMQAAMPQ